MNGQCLFIDNANKIDNFRFRFPISKRDKIRDTDHFKQAEINRLRCIPTPISRPSWDRIANMVSDLGHLVRRWDFGKRDHAHAYNNCPLGPIDSALAYIVLLNPPDRPWYAWRPSSLLSGPTAAVLHYNALSRLPSALVLHILAIPAVALYGDFCFPIDREISPVALRGLIDLADLLGDWSQTRYENLYRYRRSLFGASWRFPAPGQQYEPGHLPIGRSRCQDHRY